MQREPVLKQAARLRSHPHEVVAVDLPFVALREMGGRYTSLADLRQFHFKVLDAATVQAMRPLERNP